MDYLLIFGSVALGVVLAEKGWFQKIKWCADRPFLQPIWSRLPSRERQEKESN